MKSLYKILGISENSNPDDIKKAYRKMAKEYHPDVNKSPEAEEKFKEINSAYEVLSDPQKKAQYDRYGDNMFNHGSGQGFHEYHSSSGMGFEDILREMFGNGSNGFGGFRDMNPDKNVRVGISLEKAIQGGKLSLNIQGEEISVNLPSRIRNGTRLKVAGKGQVVNGRTGDLYIQVIVQGNNQYDIHGDDIHMVHTIDLKHAIFGGSSGFDFYGEYINIKLPSDIKFGQKIRIANKGLGQGSLILHLEIKLPTASERPDLEKIL